MMNTSLPPGVGLLPCPPVSGESHASDGLVVLRATDGSSELVVDIAAGVPIIRHWGASLGGIEPASVVAAGVRAAVAGGLDVEAPMALVPEHGSGFVGRPGLQGHRHGGRDWAPRFTLDTFALDAAALQVEAVDRHAGLRLRTRITLGDVLDITCTVVNEGDRRYLLDALHPLVPLPAHASELLTLHGRWSYEFHTERRPWPMGAWLAENRAGRTSSEHPPLVFAGTAGFGEWHGEVWGLHLAWSGNHTVLAERLADGRRYLQLGELLHPGEVCLEPGESYTTPRVVGVYSGTGLNAASQAYHRAVRAGGAQPQRPRPVLLNTWEAVYFDHDPATLRALADAAAEVGVERFVLDDGWFGGRRNDQRGLGDWWVSTEAHPDGLGPLIADVRSKGMEFGIWVEPEMVNPDSDLYRSHPEWALVDSRYEPVLGRHQLVLDLARPDAYRYVLDSVDHLLGAHDIAFVKWDMNRRHVHGSGDGGAAGTHAQTLALYRMLDELRSRHPDVEFESCSSGGARVDHEVLQRAERVWTSDCNDALERQTIQRGISLFVPPERMGAHIGPTRSHTTGRSHSLAFRGITALFGHLGIEWDITQLDAEHRRQLADVVAVHRRFRPLLHSGDVVRFDPVPGSGGHAHGVYAPDRSEAVVAYAQLTMGEATMPPPLRLPGLDPGRRYRVEHVPVISGWAPFWAQHELVLTGAQLAAHGVQLPPMHPETAILLHLTS
jgi:alpha-galactosidase